MRDELIKMVQERTGISAEQANTAVDTVVGFMKERLPEPAAGMLDSVLSGNTGALGEQAKGMMGMLGGMLGGEKK